MSWQLVLSRRRMGEGWMEGQEAEEKGDCIEGGQDTRVMR